jgi:hypothetical protein
VLPQRQNGSFGLSVADGETSCLAAQIALDWRGAIGSGLEVRSAYIRDRAVTSTRSECRRRPIWTATDGTRREGGGTGTAR